MDLAPIVLFVYNRLKHTLQTVEALKKNLLASESELFIFSDGAKNSNEEIKVNEVRKYINSIDGFKNISVITRTINFGLSNNIIDGVTQIVNKYGKIIVLEDDLVTSPYFLKFMNDGLELYKNEKNVASVHGYIYPIEGLPETFFIKGADCWGWATWDRVWNDFELDGRKLLKEIEKRNLQKEIDFNSSYGYTQMLKDQIKGKNDSWAVRWYASNYLKDMLTLYVGNSLVKNIGLDGSGTHSGKSKLLNSSNDVNFEYVLGKIKISENLEARRKMEVYLLSLRLTVFKKFKIKIRTTFL